MKNKRKIDICLTPSLLDLFNLAEKNVIIIDVFRATSAMCVFLNNGGKEVIPVSSVDEAELYKQSSHSSINNCLVAAERDGAIVPGFDLGNSPLLYHDKKFNNTSLVITTTNGTFAIEKFKKNTGQMLLASFLNATAIINHILASTGDLLIVCSGWRGRFCIEDLLLAGLLSHKLLSSNSFYSDSDSVLLGKNIYDLAKLDMSHFLSHSAYNKRMDLDDDMAYCLQTDTMDIVPVWSPDSCLNPDVGSFSLS